MTEEEAKTKWCPMVRVHTGTINYVAAANKNLLERDKGDDKCIGSACMMWRWHTSKDGIRSDLTGYCGLAGKP